MFKFWGSPQEQQVSSPRPQESTTNSWYPPSASPPSSSGSPIPNDINSNTYTERLEDRSHLSSHETQSPVVYLQDKSIDELRRLLSDQGAYQQFLLSIDPVRTQNNVRDELKKETLQLARENLEKEPQITELRNQCMIIRTMELASAQEKLHDLKKKTQLLQCYSPDSLLNKLQECMNKTDEESEMLHEQLLGKEIDVVTFTKKYKQLRINYHKQSLTYLAAKTSVVG
ncbi:vacuolar protein-sorting-associated protein 37 homolog 1 [Lactuca sativa]|uniref:VPS37 C-terminal domain-containing protein n=1 Tax=Lactuca sativa TaxID=4236 RepID=A0A9R1WTW4_LACSA|nr:vacuolar protein-sorting-associated protein 37 homolog 1 [Lactuca sativa]KAJ0228128.1 hypothetical protein LSAT_V11C100026080 [Lactuca sativa]